MLKITLALAGTRPLIQRNGRLANPMDPLTQQVNALAKKRSKTVEDYRELLPLEAYAGCWPTPDGLIGLPTANVWRSIQQAATAYKLGVKIKQALLFEAEDVAPLLIDGRTRPAKEYAYTPENLFIRTVVIQKQRTLRARTIVRQWASTHEFLLLDDVINPKDLEPVFLRAGRLVGLGDWRPLYGTYTVQVLSAEVMKEAA